MFIKADRAGGYIDKTGRCVVINLMGGQTCWAKCPFPIQEFLMSSLPFHLWTAAILKSGSRLKEIEFNVLNLVPSLHISISQNSHRIWLNWQRLLRKEAHLEMAGLLRGKSKTLESTQNSCLCSVCVVHSYLREPLQFSFLCFSGNLCM